MSFNFLKLTFKRILRSLSNQILVEKRDNFTGQSKKMKISYEVCGLWDCNLVRFRTLIRKYITEVGGSTFDLLRKLVTRKRFTIRLVMILWRWQANYKRKCCGIMGYIHILTQRTLVYVYIDNTAHVRMRTHTKRTKGTISINNQLIITPAWGVTFSLTFLWWK